MIFGRKILSIMNLHCLDGTPIPSELVYLLYNIYDSASKCKLVLKLGKKWEIYYVTLVKINGIDSLLRLYFYLKNIMFLNMVKAYLIKTISIYLMCR